MDGENQPLPHSWCPHRKLLLLAGLLMITALSCISSSGVCFLHHIHNNIIIHLFDVIWCHLSKHLLVTDNGSLLFVVFSWNIVLFFPSFSVVVVFFCFCFFSQVAETSKLPVTPGTVYKEPPISTDQPYLWAARQDSAVSSSCLHPALTTAMLVVSCTIEDVNKILCLSLSAHCFGQSCTEQMWE